MPTDLNTLDDWWNEGFDDFFAGAFVSEGPYGAGAYIGWLYGWKAARNYQRALKGRDDE